MYFYCNKLFVCLSSTMVFLRAEGYVLFNDSLKTFYFTVIWRRTDSKRTTQICRKGSFYAPLPQTEMVLGTFTISSYVHV